MDFVMPTYTAPDFTRPEFLSAPDAAFRAVERDGVAPENFHSTSMYPEYVKLEGRWRLAEESRMDSCIVWNADGSLSVVESRNLKKGDRATLRLILQSVPERVHTILPGLAILTAVLKAYQVETVSVSSCGVREGYLLDRVMGVKEKHEQ